MHSLGLSPVLVLLSQAAGPKYGAAPARTASSGNLSSEPSGPLGAGAAAAAAAASVANGRGACCRPLTKSCSLHVWTLRDFHDL